MPSLRQIRRRIRSVKSTARITKAMEMVAASKMRRAQQRVIAGRPYADRIRDVLADIAARIPADGPTHPLLQTRPVKRVGFVLVTADRGLCGGFNANMTRRAAQMVVESEYPVSIIAVGRKGRDFMIRAGKDVRAEFTNLGDLPNLVDILPIARIAIDDYLNGLVDEVYVGYSKFVNTLVQKPTVARVLPVEPPPDLDNREYIYEPDATQVLGDLVPRYVEMQIYSAILESIASEQSARMVAMRNATESAKDVISELTLTANKVRQEVITKELLEIVGGVAALNG